MKPLFEIPELLTCMEIHLMVNLKMSMGRLVALVVVTMVAVQAVMRGQEKVSCQIPLSNNSS